MEYICKNFSNLGEKVYSGKLDSGLTCIYIPKPGFKRKFAILATPYGAVHREATVGGKNFSTPAGIAHFLEHKMFENPNESIENKFASFGASVNAYTTHTSTAYLFSTAENFYNCLNLLLDFVQKPQFTEEGVISERSIIAQEIKMYNDQPNWSVYLAALQGMYDKHPVAEDIAGKIEDLDEIDYELLKECHRLFYHPQRMVLVVAGDLDGKELFEKVAVNQRAKKFDPLPELDILVPKPQDKVMLPQQSSGMEVSRPLLCLGIRDKVADSWPGAVKREQVASLLLETFIGKNSPFYNRLYDDGLIDSSFGAEYTSAPWYSHFIFGGETDQPEKLAQELIAELRRLQECGVNPQLLENNHSKMMGLYIMDLNGLESTVMATASDWLEEFDYFERFNAIKELTKEDVDGMLSELDLDMTCLSVVNPLSI